MLVITNHFNIQLSPLLNYSQVLEESRKMVVVVYIETRNT